MGYPICASNYADLEFLTRKTTNETLGILFLNSLTNTSKELVNQLYEGITEALSKRKDEAATYLRNLREDLDPIPSLGKRLQEIYSKYGDISIRVLGNAFTRGCESTEEALKTLEDGFLD